MSSSTEAKIRTQLADNPIILYMKGVPDNPECGFSAKAVACLKQTGIPYTFVNVLGAPFIREKLPKISKWPTYPQLFINQELIGGSDIIEAMLDDGSLLPALQKAQVQTSAASPSAPTTPQLAETLIKSAYPDAQIGIEGEGCDLSITIISEKFTGQTMIQQQQGVLQTLQEPLASGQLHAVSLKTYTPEQWSEKQADAGNGLMQIQI